MPDKHLILIHGRATKPPRVAKRRLVKKALVGGVNRVDEKAARAIESGRVKFSLAYYGDINNRLMVAAEPERKRHLFRLWLSVDGARPIPPVLAERTQGGIVLAGTRLKAPLEAE